MYVCSFERPPLSSKLMILEHADPCQVASLLVADWYLKLLAQCLFTYCMFSGTMLTSPSVTSPHRLRAEGRFCRLRAEGRFGQSSPRPDWLWLSAEDRVPYIIQGMCKIHSILCSHTHVLSHFERPFWRAA